MHLFPQLADRTLNSNKLPSENQYVLVIGAANIDLCGRAFENFKPDESNPGKLDISVGGVGRNIADNLARLGADSRLLTIVGDDHWGQQILTLTEQTGVNVELCISQALARSSTYLSLHNPDGEMQMALSDMSIIDQLNAGELSQQVEQIKASDVLVLDANLSDNALEYCFSCEHQTVFVDPVSSAKAIKLKPFLSAINTLKPNRREAELLSGLAITSVSDIASAAKELHQKGVENIFISSGALGGYWSTDFGAKADMFPTSILSENPIANVTGAGDALMAALIYGKTRGWDWRTVARFAMATSAVTVSVESSINSQLSESLVLRNMEQRLC